jgi:hypothetical protein
MSIFTHSRFREPINTTVLAHSRFREANNTTVLPHSRFHEPTNTTVLPHSRFREPTNTAILPRSRFREPSNMTVLVHSSFREPINMIVLAHSRFRELFHTGETLKAPLPEGRKKGAFGSSGKHKAKNRLLANYPATGGWSVTASGFSPTVLLSSGVNTSLSLGSSLVELIPK